MSTESTPITQIDVYSYLNPTYTPAGFEVGSRGSFYIDRLYGHGVFWRGEADTSRLHKSREEERERRRPTTYQDKVVDRSSQKRIYWWLPTSGVDGGRRLIGPVDECGHICHLAVLKSDLHQLRVAVCLQQKGVHFLKKSISALIIIIICCCCFNYIHLVDVIIIIDQTRKSSSPRANSRRAKGFLLGHTPPSLSQIMAQICTNDETAEALQFLGGTKHFHPSHCACNRLTIAVKNFKRSGRGARTWDVAG